MLQLKEKRASACPYLPTRYIIPSDLPHEKTGIQAGGIFVDQSATEFFTDLFTRGGLDLEDVKEYTDEAGKAFEAEAKKAFSDPRGEEVSLKVANHKTTERSVGIRRGILNVSW